MLQVLVMQWPRHGNDPSSWCAVSANLSMSAGTVLSSSPHPSSAPLTVPPGGKASTGDLACVFMGFFPTFDLR